MLALASHDNERAGRAFASVALRADDNPEMRNSIRIAQATLAARDGNGVEAIKLAARAAQGDAVREDVLPFANELLSRDDLTLDNDTVTRLGAWNESL